MFGWESLLIVETCQESIMLRRWKRSHRVYRSALVLVGLLCAACLGGKPRIVVLTDIGADPDDIQSMVRLLTYANEFDIEGLIPGTCVWMMNDKPEPRPRMQPLLDVIDTYEKVYENLLLHCRDYPTPDHLRSVSKMGVNGYGMGPASRQLDNEGVNHIIAVLEKDDPRPVWFLGWGGTNTLGAAVMKIKSTRPTEEARALADRIRGYEIAMQDDGFAYVAHRLPGVKLISSQSQWRGFSQLLPDKQKVLPQWRESWGGNNDVMNEAWFRTHVQRDHGPLGTAYPDAVWLFEGDTTSFLYLLPNGLHFPEYPHFGGWGGRFEPEPRKNITSGVTMPVGGQSNHTVDRLLEQWHDYELYADANDQWSYQGTHYDNIYCAIFRWREAFQWDFAARMDRTIKPFSEVNHNPIVVVDGDQTRNLITKHVAAGTELVLDAAGTTDPDGDALSHSWWVYPEPGTYAGTVAIRNSQSQKATVVVPSDAGGSSFHVILTVRDNGVPPLEGYRRVLVECKAASMPVAAVP